MAEVRWGVYAWTHIPTGRTYIGQAGRTTGFGRRRSVHLCQLRSGKHHSVHFQRAWDKHGESEFAWSVIEDLTDSGIDDDELNAHEQWWIDNTDSQFNGRRTAESNRGWKPRPETLVKLSESHKGITHSPQTLAKLSEVSRRHWQDPEYRAKHRASQVGQKRSPGARANMSAAQRSRTVVRTPEAHARMRLAHSNPSDETRARMSAAAKKRTPWNKGKKTGPRSDETKAKIGDFWRGTTRPPEVCAQISATLMNHPVSDETKAKISATKKRNFAVKRLMAFLTSTPALFC